MIRNSGFLIFFLILSCTLQSSATAELAAPLSDQDRGLLEQIQRDAFRYFLMETDSETGLTKDSSGSAAPASIAATGFALASFGIGTKHGWLSYREAYERIERTIITLERTAASKNGFFYHFLDPRSGKRVWNSELSSIDTALLMAGLLLAATYFPGTEVEERAFKLYERVDWNWMRNGTFLFNHGWRPKTGFLSYYWDMYSEHLILQALALGSETHPVPNEVWYAWRRDEEFYNGSNIIYSSSGSLFTYQYSHAYIDFRKLEDRGVNYFENSVNATLANRVFSESHQEQYETYQELWGLSACLGPDGYKAYGAEPGLALHDGTVAVYAPIASIVFTPEASLAAIRLLFDLHQDRLYGKYGFLDSINQSRGWVADDYLGIDQGIIILMLENFLYEGAIWKRFHELAPIKRWIARADLQPAQR